MILATGISTCVAATGTVAAEALPNTLKPLGERLSFDENLSANRTQACATCHDPDHAFSDPRGMASPGDDGISLGDRNAPTAMYAALTPALHKGEDGAWFGGRFLDGRASTLEDQAVGPPLNPIETGMADEAAVVARLKEDPVCLDAFPAVFEPGILDDPAAGYAAMTRAIAAFERTEGFSPFTSKYDRFLRGEAVLTDEEDLGRLLFFSEQFMNCNQCHQLGVILMDPAETFTDFSYHNIGVPENLALRDRNGVAPGTIDEGLALNPALAGDPSARGKFRTPTLRNFAVTEPYMHNRVFADPPTVVLLYNQDNTTVADRRINPETGVPFRMPPVPMTLATEELTRGPALEDQRIDALVAFMKTHTDERYEALLEE